MHGKKELAEYLSRESGRKRNDKKRKQEKNINRIYFFALHGPEKTTGLSALVRRRTTRGGIYCHVEPAPKK